MSNSNNNNTDTSKLDNMTVRRFSRLLKKDSSNSSSPIATGTLVQDGNTLYVTVNGSNIPISQSTTGVTVGDDVTIIYGDDEAYIIGNNSDPSTTTTELTETQKKITKAKKEAQQASENAQTASEKADALQLELDASNAKITDLSTEVGTVGTKVENAIEKADESLTTATEAKQTATELTGTVTRAYENAEEALEQSSSAVQTATSVQTTLSENYYTKDETAKTYASQSQLTQTAKDITASIEETVGENYATKTELTTKAGEITSTLTSNYTETGKDTNYTQQSTFKQTVEGLEASIKSTGDDAKKVATNYLSYTSSGGLVVGNMTASTLGGNTQITSTGVNVRNGTTTLGSFTGSTITLGKTASGNNNTYINTSGISMRNGSTVLANFTSSSSTIGRTASGYNNTYIDTNGIQLRNGTTTLANFTSSSSTIGKTSSNNVVVNTSGMSVNDGSEALASFTSLQAVIGKTSSNNVEITTSAVNVRNNGTTLASFGSGNFALNNSSGVKSFVITAPTSTVGTSTVSLDTNMHGLYLNLGKTAKWDGALESAYAREGYLSDWIILTGDVNGWTIRKYAENPSVTYSGKYCSWCEFIYHGEKTPASTAISISYPNSYKLKTNTPYYVGASPTQSGTTGSYAGYISAGSTGVYFYLKGGSSTTSSTYFSLYICGYFYK